MVKQYKSNLIRKVFEEFANAHKGETLSARAINEGVQQSLDYDIKGELCASDFALPETSHSRSKHNKTLFERIKRGWYKVL